jgi:hypothetical protein
MLYVTSTARSDIDTLESFDNASFANPFFVPSLSMEVNRIPLPLFVPLLLPNQINLIPLALCLLPNEQSIDRQSAWHQSRQHIDCQISVPNH